jgi:hypothetical protein
MQGPPAPVCSCLRSPHLPPGSPETGPKALGLTGPLAIPASGLTKRSIEFSNPSSHPLTPRIGPHSPTGALQQVGRFLGYSGYQIHAVVTAARDPERKSRVRLCANERPLVSIGEPHLSSRWEPTGQDYCPVLRCGAIRDALSPQLLFIPHKAWTLSFWEESPWLKVICKKQILALFKTTWHSYVCCPTNLP